jgi:hypothetical protein
MKIGRKFLVSCAELFRKSFFKEKTSRDLNELLYLDEKNPRLFFWKGSPF